MLFFLFFLVQKEEKYGQKNYEINTEKKKSLVWDLQMSSQKILPFHGCSQYKAEIWFGSPKSPVFYGPISRSSVFHCMIEKKRFSLVSKLQADPVDRQTITDLKDKRQISSFCSPNIFLETVTKRRNYPFVHGTSFSNCSSMIVVQS